MSLWMTCLDGLGALFQAIILDKCIYFKPQECYANSNGEVITMKQLSVTEPVIWVRIVLIKTVLSPQYANTFMEMLSS